MQITNLAGLPEGKLRSWLPHDLDAERVVFFPDACPGRSPLPTGTAVLLRREGWRRFAVSDVGCGMRLLRAPLGTDALTAARWDQVAALLRANKGALGDLGGGNHFLDALEPYDGDQLHFLVHTGSRSESGLVDDLVADSAAFDAEFARITGWARDNRAAVQAALERVFGPLDVILDLPHNSYEELPDGAVVVRKGAVHLRPGELSILPSHMAGDVALVRATPAVADTLESMSHGTGRAVARGESKALAASYDFAALRRRVLVPGGVDDASLRTEGPYAYRDLDECLALLDGLVSPERRYAVVGYMGHL